jgi:hypothetical protein
MMLLAQLVIWVKEQPGSTFDILDASWFCKSFAREEPGFRIPCAMLTASELNHTSHHTLNAHQNKRVLVLHLLQGGGKKRRKNQVMPPKLACVNVCFARTVPCHNQCGTV